MNVNNGKSVLHQRSIRDRRPEKGQAMVPDDASTFRRYVLCALIGALATLGGALAQSWIQMRVEIGKVRADVAAQDYKDFISKSEKLFGALADLISFFDANHSYEPKLAKPVIAQARKAAFEFAVYAPPKLAHNAIMAIEALNQGVDSYSPQQLEAALIAIAALSKELTASFYLERATLDQRRNKALE